MMVPEREREREREREATAGATAGPSISWLTKCCEPFAQDDGGNRQKQGKDKDINNDGMRVGKISWEDRLGKMGWEK